MTRSKHQIGPGLRVMFGISLAALIVAAGLASLRSQELPPFNREHSDLSPASAPEFSSFPLYAFGNSYDGLPLTAITRRLQPRSDVLESEPRANYVGFLYGDCEAISDTGCAPPLEVQIWPACERNLASYSLTPDGRPLPHERTTLRGVPAATFDDGYRLELYTGRVSVILFGLDPDMLRESVEALIGINEDKIGSSEPLPPPAVGALEGELTCTPTEEAPGLPTG